MEVKPQGNILQGHLVPLCFDSILHASPLAPVTLSIFLELGLPQPSLPFRSCHLPVRQPSRSFVILAGEIVTLPWDISRGAGGNAVMRRAMFYSLAYSSIFCSISYREAEAFPKRPEAFGMAFSCHKPQTETVCEEQDLLLFFPRWRDRTDLS